MPPVTTVPPARLAGRYALLDRDGTIIVDKHYLADPAGVELLPGALEGLQAMRDLGLGLVVVSNQSGVGRGMFGEAEVRAVNARLAELLAQGGVEMAGWYHCPHAPEAGCQCRKPAPGLLLAAARDLGFEAAQAFVVGDKASDVELGRRCGAGSILVRTGKGLQAQSRCTPDHVADDLRGAAAYMATRM